MTMMLQVEQVFTPPGCLEVKALLKEEEGVVEEEQYLCHQMVKRLLYRLQDMDLEEEKSMKML